MHTSIAHGDILCKIQYIPVFPPSAKSVTEEEEKEKKKNKKKKMVIVIVMKMMTKNSENHM